MARKPVKAGQIRASLKPAQVKAIAYLAAGMTFSAAAKRAGVSRNTLYAWRRTEEFAKPLRDMQTDALAGAIGILKAKAQLAAKALAKAARFGDEIGAVPGARAVLDFAFKGVEFEVLDERLRKLEEAQSAKT